jgi:hypothetical protein
MIAKTKELVTKHWKTALTWLLLPTVLVVAYYAYKHFKKSKSDDTEGVVDTIENRVTQLNQCGTVTRDGEIVSNCTDLLQQVMGEARSKGKNIILLDDKYVIA